MRGVASRDLRCTRRIMNRLSRDMVAGKRDRPAPGRGRRRGTPPHTLGGWGVLGPKKTKKNQHVRINDRSHLDGWQNLSSLTHPPRPGDTAVSRLPRLPSPVTEAPGQGRQTARHGRRHTRRHAGPPAAQWPRRGPAHTETERGEGKSQESSASRSFGVVLGHEGQVDAEVRLRSLELSWVAQVRWLLEVVVVVQLHLPLGPTEVVGIGGVPVLR